MITFHGKLTLIVNHTTELLTTVDALKTENVTYCLDHQSGRGRRCIIIELDGLPFKGGHQLYYHSLIVFVTAPFCKVPN